MDISLQIAAVNSDLMYQQLAAGGYADASIMADPTANPPVTVVVHLPDDAAQPLIDAAIAIIKAHDPKQLTAAQSAAAQVTTTTDTLLAKLKNEVAYFNAVPAADLTNGAAVQRLCSDFGLLLTSLSTRLNP